MLWHWSPEPPRCGATLCPVEGAESCPSGVLLPGELGVSGCGGCLCPRARGGCGQLLGFAWRGALLAPPHPHGVGCPLALDGSRQSQRGGLRTCCCLGAAKTGVGGGCPTACTCKEWGPLCVGRTVHGGDAANLLLWGWRTGWYWGATPLPLGGQQARQCTAPLGYASPLLLCFLPALGLASGRGLAEGLAGGRTALPYLSPRLPPLPPPRSLLASEELKLSPCDEYLTAEHRLERRISPGCQRCLPPQPCRLPGCTAEEARASTGGPPAAAQPAAGMGTQGLGITFLTLPLVVRAATGGEMLRC